MLRSELGPAQDGTARRVNARMPPATAIEYVGIIKVVNGDWPVLIFEECHLLPTRAVLLASGDAKEKGRRSGPLKVNSRGNDEGGRSSQ